MKDNKILFISAANPTRAYSGIKYLFYALKNKYYKIDIWVAVPFSQKKSLKQWEGNVHSFYFSVLGRIPKFRRVIMHLRVIQLCFKYRNEIIICHELWFYKYCIWVKTLFPNTKVIHYSTELFDENDSKVFMKLLKYYKKHINDIDFVIECDEKRREYREKTYNLKKPSVTIYNTIPKYEIKKYNQVKKTESETPIIVYVGGAFLHRQLNKIIDAVSMLKTNYEFKIYCYGEDKAIRELEQRCKEKIHDKNFFIYQDMTRETLFDFVRQADIGIVYYDPSLSIGNRYAAPTKFFEYIALGVPVVSSNNESLVNIIDKYNVGMYVKDSTVNSLYEVLNSLLKDKELRQKISLSEKKAFELNLCYEEQTKEAFDIMEKVVF